MWCLLVQYSHVSSFEQFLYSMSYMLDSVHILLAVVVKCEMVRLCIAPFGVGSVSHLWSLAFGLNSEHLAWCTLLFYENAFSLMIRASSFNCSSTSVSVMSGSTPLITIDSIGGRRGGAG